MAWKERRTDAVPRLPGSAVPLWRTLHIVQEYRYVRHVGVSELVVKELVQKDFVDPILAGSLDRADDLEFTVVVNQKIVLITRSEKLHAVLISHGYFDNPGSTRDPRCVDEQPDQTLEKIAIELSCLIGRSCW